MPHDTAADGQPLAAGPNEPLPVKRPGSRPKRRRLPRRYRPFVGHPGDAEQRLGRLDLTNELAVMRVRLAELLDAGDTDWLSVVRAVDSINRLARAQVLMPATSGGGSLETVQAFGDYLHDLLRSPDDPGPFEPPRSALGPVERR